MKTMLSAVAISLSLAAALPAAAQKDSALDTRINDSAQVIKEIMATPEGGVPKSIIDKTTCLAIIPSVKKAAFIVGGSYGQGVVTCRTAHGWSGPVFIRLGGGSVGFQIGGQATDLVLVAVNDKGLQDLLHSKFKIGADAAAAAGPVGRNASASTDILLKAELLSYSRSRGAFAGIDLNGASILQNVDDTNKLYGAPHSFTDILHGTVETPDSARSFVTQIEQSYRPTP